MTLEEALIEGMENLDEEAVLGCVRELRSGGGRGGNRGRDNIAVIYALNQGMLDVGRRFEIGEYYLADLIVSGSIYRHALKLLELGVKGGSSRDKSADTSRPVKDDGSRRGCPVTVLIGVVKNDIHDIGKDIVAGTLSAGGVKVIDLGIDVDAGEFVRGVRLYKPHILALGGTMGFAVDEMERIIRALADEKLRSGLLVIAGGIAINRESAIRIGADFYAPDPMQMLDICKHINNQQ
jgi:methanogenic corrinoid protein MtbC1